MKTLLRGLVFGLVFGALVSLMLVRASAQDFFYTGFHWGYVDHALPDAPPCMSHYPVMPWTHDGLPAFAWTCDDGRVISRRFFTASPTPTAGVPVPTVVPVPPSELCPTTKPGPGWVCGADGGWRPR